MLFRSGVGVGLCIQGLNFSLTVYHFFSGILGSAMPRLSVRRICFPTFVFTLSELVYFFPTGSSDEEDCLTMRNLFPPFKLQCRVCVVPAMFIAQKFAD